MAILKPAETKLPSGYERIYFYHIRRVGGTSLNQAFFQLNSRNPGLVSSAIRRSKRKIVHLNGVRYVGGNHGELDSGRYFYGFSHIPSHVLRLPPKTFTVTLLRDPVARIISHYKMVLYHERNHIERHWMPLERQWLGKSFRDFYRNLPRERLYAQLFMFSQGFDIDEAAREILQCGFSFRTENYAAGIKDLSDRLDLALLMRHSHRFDIDAEISRTEIANLSSLMEPEYELLRRLQESGYGR